MAARRYEISLRVLVECEFALLRSLRDYSKHFNVPKVWQTLENETRMNGAQFSGENENLFSSANILPKTSNLVISRCCFADDGKEIDKMKRCTCRACKAFDFAQ